MERRAAFRLNRTLAGTGDSANLIARRHVAQLYATVRYAAVFNGRDASHECHFAQPALFLPRATSPRAALCHDRDRNPRGAHADLAHDRAARQRRFRSAANHWYPPGVHGAPAKLSRRTDHWAGGYYVVTAP